MVVIFDIFDLFDFVEAKIGCIWGCINDFFPSENIKKPLCLSNNLKVAPLLEIVYLSLENLEVYSGAFDAEREYFTIVVYDEIFDVVDGVNK